METTNLYPFHADGKALASARELDTGDLIIEGFAADFSGVDRQGENFAPGAFRRGIDAFLRRQASLNWHHKHDHGIGKVLELREIEGKGLWMRARVDYQPESSPLHWIYNGIRKGTYNALSVGGFFARRLTAGGWRISGVDFTEISVTPVPVHPGTSFAVVAGKALDDMRGSSGASLDDLLPELRMLSLKADIAVLEYATADLIRERV
jgi:HK97 family phage prohead protease